MPSTTTPAAGPASPDWLAAAAKLDLGVEPERIALRGSSAAAKPAEPKKLAPEPAPRLKLAETPAPEAKPAKPPRDLDHPGYPSRVMLPETITLAALSACWVIFAVPLFPAIMQTMEVYGAIPGAFGLFQLTRWLFRYYSGGYRLTHRAIIRVSPGPLADPEPISLTTIASVTPRQTIEDRFLFTGTIHLTFERETQEEIVLGPVSFPRQRAKKIEAAIAAAREGGVLSGRVAA